MKNLRNNKKNPEKESLVPELESFELKMEEIIRKTEDDKQVTLKNARKEADAIISGARTELENELKKERETRKQKIEDRLIKERRDQEQKLDTFASESEKHIPDAVRFLTAKIFGEDLS